MPFPLSEITSYGAIPAGDRQVKRAGGRLSDKKACSGGRDHVGGDIFYVGENVQPGIILVGQRPAVMHILPDGKS